MKRFYEGSIFFALILTLIISTGVVAPAYAATGANFAETASELYLDLNAGVSVTVVSNGTSYTLTLGGTDTWSGTDSANVTGNGTSTLTVTSAGIAVFTDIIITDSGDAASVTFNDSGVNTFSENITVTLDNTGAAVYLNGDITTSGTLSITGDTIMLADTVITSSGNGDVTFNSKINGLYSLTINTSGITTFNGVVGGDGGDRLGGLTTDTGGTSVLNGTTNIRRIYVQNEVFFGDDVVVNGGGQYWYFYGDTTFDGNLSGNVDIIISAYGEMTFNGTVSFRGLQIPGNGPVYINGGSITTTTYGISFTTDVVLGADTVVNSNDYLRFRGALDGAYDLTLNASDVTNFQDTVGGTAPLNSLTTDAAGTTLIQSSGFNLSGALTFNDPVTLSVDTQITSTGSGDVTFDSTLDGLYGLTVNTTGATIFNDLIGSTTRLGGLTTDAGGTSVFNGTTDIRRIYVQNEAFFGDDVVVNGGGQYWYFYGNTTFDGSLSGNVDIIIVAYSEMTFNGTVSFRGLQIPGNGPVYLNGGLVTTTEYGVDFSIDVVLGADTIINSSDYLRFRESLDGAYDLTLNAPDVTNFQDTVGGTTPLNSLTTNAAGTTLIQGGEFNLSGNTLTFNDPVTLSVDTVITDAGAVAFNNTVDGSYTLSVNAGGIVSFYDAVGGTTTLNGLTVTADAMSLADSINVGTNIVTLSPRTAGYPVSLGIEFAGSLSLTDAEIDQITAGTLRVGSSSAGSITFNGNISLSGASTLSLITGDEILDNNPGTDVAGTNLAIQAVNGICDNELLETEVSTVAALNTTTGSIAILETFAGGDLIVGTVDGVVGLRNESYTGPGYAYSVQLETTNGDLTIDDDIYNARVNIYVVAQENNGGTGDSLFTNNANINNDGENIYVLANNMTLTSGSQISSPSLVILQNDPASLATVAINLGGADGPNTLGLTDEELTTVTANKLQIGNNKAGNISVLSDIDLTDGPNIAATELRTGAAISGSNFRILTANSLDLFAGTSIGANGNPFAMNASILTTSGNGDQYLFEENNVSVGSSDLVAGSGNTIQFDDGVFVTDGSGSDIQNNANIISGATLKGTGTVFGSAAVQSGGILAPGDDLGVLFTGDASFATGGSFFVNINGSTTAGTDYDQLDVTGAVTINNANLILSGTPSGTSNGDEIVLISNDGIDAVSGTFSGLAEAAVISDFAGSSYDAQISYQGGDGNDVTLIVLHPEIDVQRPAGTSILDGNTDAQGSLQPVAQTLTYTVANTGASPLDVTNITTTNLTNVTVNSISSTAFSVASGSTGTFDVQFTPISDGAFSFDLDIVNNDADEANYDIAVSGTNDGTAPIVTIEQGSTQFDPTNTSPIFFDVTFSEDVTGFDEFDVTITGMAGTPVVTVTGTGTGDTYSVEVIGMADGETVSASIVANVAQDSAGNLNMASTSTDNSVTYDLSGPTVTIEQGSSQADPTNTSPIVFDVTFSEVVTGFDELDVVITGLAGTPGITVTSTGEGDTYSVEVTGMVDGEVISATIPANVAKDNAGNDSAASTSTDNSVTYDVSAIEVVTNGIVGLNGNNLLKNNGVYINQFNSLEITYNTDAYDPVDSSDADDVTNPANYLLIQAGIDGLYNTASCLDVSNNGGAVLGDDVKIPTGPVVYDPATLTANVSINNGVPLPYGEYRLFLCGTTSITDLAGNALNGGVDIVLTFTLENPEELPDTGFMPGEITALSVQPADKVYDVTDMVLEIQKLDVLMPIVGVPYVDRGWDVDWLGNSAGYLYGSAYPTWAGNTVITGHVWDVNNHPGPFAELNILQYGDSIQIQTGGQIYTYEVRESMLVSAKESGVVLQSEEYDWVTLVTCELYDSASGEYLYRRVVRAVLISVE